MKVVFTGGGTGGHFYPLIAVAEELHSIVDTENIAEVEFFYFADTEYDKQALFEQGMTFKVIAAGKWRLNFSIQNFTDIFVTLRGIFQAIGTLFSVFPDVVFSKGGYASFPTIVAARLLGIPVILHESDSVPGRVNRWTARFAKRIALSYPEAAEYFKKEKVAVTGQPVRKELLHPIEEGSHEYLKLEEDVPVVLVLGGSQGAQKINELILSALPELVKQYQIIHQVGKDNLEEHNQRTETVLERSQFRMRYKTFGFLNPLAMSMAAGAASLVVSRAGSTIFEIATWQLPSIIIPLPISVSRDQRSNAFSYARTGACEVMEEENTGPQVLLSEIHRILSDKALCQSMIDNTAEFRHLDAGKKIGREIVKIGLKHENKDT